MKLKILIAFIILGIVGFGIYFNSRVKNNSDVQVNVNIDKITVTPQGAKTSVTIDSATLSIGGYIVIHGSDGKRLGQIIEVSKYLEAGVSKNIIISLGDFYTDEEKGQLIAMIYHDDGDKVFNDLDQPASSPSAVFVKTATSVPTSVLSQQAAPANGMGMETVVYTNDGFRPAKLTIPVGTMVEFVNQSDKQMWVASNIHPSHEILPTFDEFKGVGKGQTYMYTFDKKGTWPYHDHINASLEGVINVE